LKLHAFSAAAAAKGGGGDDTNEDRASRTEWFNTANFERPVHMNQS
jgi:hypothetical protein